MDAVLHNLLHGVQPSFPGLNDPPLTTPPFCGILVPPTLRAAVVKSSLFEAIAAADPAKYAAATSSAKATLWHCWLCGSRNAPSCGSCSKCARDRFPSWLRAASGDAFEVGSLVNYRGEGGKLLGILTQVDYLKKEIHAYLVPVDRVEHSSKDFPVLHKIPASEITRGRLLLVEKDNPLAQQVAKHYCEFLLCGKCGLVSRVDNGTAVMVSDLGRADKEGRLRSLRAEVDRKRNEVKYLTRRFRESKTGYEKMVVASNELKQLKERERELVRLTSEPEFWCPYCSWEWPQDFPYQIK